MLAQHHGRWTNIKTTLVQRFGSCWGVLIWTHVPFWAFNSDFERFVPRRTILVFERRSTQCSFQKNGQNRSERPFWTVGWLKTMIVVLNANRSNGTWNGARTAVLADNYYRGRWTILVFERRSERSVHSKKNGQNRSERPFWTGGWLKTMIVVLNANRSNGTWNGVRTAVLVEYFYRGGWCGIWSSCPYHWVLILLRCILGQEPDLALVGYSQKLRNFLCDFYLAWPLGHSEFWFFFAKQDALSPRANFTIYQKDTKIKLTAFRKIVQNSSSFTYFHYCFIHSPRPYTHVGHWKIF